MCARTAHACCAQLGQALVTMVRSRTGHVDANMHFNVPEDDFFIQRFTFPTFPKIGTEFMDIILRFLTIDANHRLGANGAAEVMITNMLHDERWSQHRHRRYDDN